PTPPRALTQVFLEEAHPAEDLQFPAAEDSPGGRFDRYAEGPAMHVLVLCQRLQMAQAQRQDLRPPAFEAKMALREGRLPQDVRVLLEPIDQDHTVAGIRGS